MLDDQETVVINDSTITARSFLNRNDEIGEQAQQLKYYRLRVAIA